MIAERQRTVALNPDPSSTRQYKDLFLLDNQKVLIPEMFSSTFPNGEWLPKWKGVKSASSAVGVL